MIVSANQLVAGCIVTADVMGKSGLPLVKSKTILTESDIFYLQKLLVKEVPIASHLEDGTSFVPSKEFVKPKMLKKEQNFLDALEAAADAYQKQFASWQHGAAVDASSLRQMLLPVMEKAASWEGNIFNLPSYRTQTDYVSHHAIGIALLAAAVLQKAGYTEADVNQTALAALLADCGMAKLKQPYFLQKRRLHAHEREDIEKHPTLSYRMIEQVSHLSTKAKLAILQHHERADGTGYPLRLSKDKIHPFASLVSICDTYHALISERAHQRAVSPYRAVEIILDEQFERFDPSMVQSFIQAFLDAQQKTTVRLSSGQLAEIVFTDSSNPTKPMVRELESGEVKAMNEYPDLHIEEVIK
ncbi:HD-GYP domain, c-di-GMP phosphodiesterase class II (or its inactivated variant) [Terribacillus aidingensis]|uniref:HD-GYP domain, c-di-GMP phosphodiesterase class II (Or its inactivated variant) n=1 Tax=Terribacillus aidingensis TaxID=586416 RepID=A0A285MYE8_9BACI|nr:HD domain-containing phosphohydrolase [Terribacillus aidingensis]SNZ02204.1 HD-GYP domain, c-di-GMP phosphodiesterase class II (or its inactivated variant) [Terribacillus aidingensis]